GQVVIQRSVAARHALQPVVEIHHDFVQRKFVSEHHTRRREILEVFLDAALLLAEPQDAANGFVTGDDHGLDDGLFDLADVAGIGEFRGAIHFYDRFADAGDAVTHAGRGGDQVETKFAFQPLLHNLHVQQPEKATAVTKA